MLAAGYFFESVEPFVLKPDTCSVRVFEPCPFPARKSKRPGSTKELSKDPSGVFGVIEPFRHEDDIATVGARAGEDTILTSSNRLNHALLRSGRIDVGGA